MATYCIGDLQGCFDELQQLLHTIDYKPQKDSLWFVGDLVNRGPKSLETLRFIKNLPNTKIVLGNHDLHLINFYHDIIDFETEHLREILAAKDAPELISWLRSQPLIYYDIKHNTAITHAGIYPGWNLNEALNYAKEVENKLQDENYISFLKNLYGNEPSTWNKNLRGDDRLRFITNAFTRMRFCNSAGQLEFVNSGAPNTAPLGFMPWFKIPTRKTKNIKIVFGHWASLKGVCDEPNIFALDTGCVYGEFLTAMRLEDNAIFTAPFKFI
jgi:bis(5'-nucleosyl)-tetraphosphatase (symmetrical)